MTQISPSLYFGPINVNNVGQLRRLQESILPVKYQESFYSQVLGYSVLDIAKLAYFKDVIVGASCCRIEEGKMLYVMTLCVLPAYRSRGIGRHLLDHMLVKAKELGAVGVYLHVWVTNTEAIEFYAKAGFTIKETLKGYYKRIDPPDAHILEKLF